jgi:hypothetical protein
VEHQRQALLQVAAAQEQQDLGNYNQQLPIRLSDTVETELQFHG